MMDSISQDPKKPTEQSFARTPQELLHWNILNAYQAAIDAQGQCQRDRMRGSRGETWNFSAAVKRLYMFIRPQMANKEPEKVKKIDELLEITGEKQWDSASTAFNHINQHLYDVKLTNFATKREVDRSRIWKANEADGVTPTGHPWWNEKNPYWMDANEKWKKIQAELDAKKEPPQNG